MLALFLTLLLSHGVPTPPEGGQVSGVLRTATGVPAAGVRIAATAPSTDLADTAATLISLTETDNEGRFLLENVPPGRYYIIAGRIVQPTFYPGTLEAENGTLLTIKDGDRISGIDFVIAESSYRPLPLPTPTVSKVQVTVPITVTVEGGGTLPASTTGRIPTVQLVPVSGGKNLEASLNSSNIAILVSPVTEEYRVRIENLPEGYRVKSMTFGSTDLVTDTLKASLREIPVVPTLRIVTFTGEGETQRIIDRIVEREFGPKTLAIMLTTN